MVENKLNINGGTSTLSLIAKTSAITSVVAISFLLSTAAMAASKDHVIVIDEGVDLSHFELKNRSLVNPLESSGNKNYDDDRNGFVDDVSGWNLISNDSEFFPAHVSSVFEKNNATVSQLLELYNKIEEGDKEAIELVYGNPDTASAMSWVLGKSHGTHVAGIISTYGNKNALVASANIFTSSKEEEEESNDAGSMSAPASLNSGYENFSKGLIALVNRNAATIASDDSAATTKPASVFDDTDGINQYVKDSAKEDLTEKQLTSRYLRTTGARVANLSLGFAKVTWKMRLDAIWTEYLKKNSLPKDLAMNATQKANYNLLLTIYDNSQKNWNFLFKSNPNTLFVIAAGNDGEMQVPNAGNNAINEVVPANCSADNANVITVAATTKEGVLADFSNYNSRFVNLGAWGVAVPSLAPNNNRVKMSGTSMASPYVAGVASAMFSANEKLTPAQAKEILQKTASFRSSLEGKVTSNGMVDPAAAVKAASALNAGFSLSEATTNAGSVFDRILPGFGTNPGFVRTADTTLRGQVHKTNSLVKRFLR